MNFVSRLMLLCNALILVWMCYIPLWALQIPDEAEPDVASGTVELFQPRRLRAMNSPFRRHLSQSSRSDDEDVLSCELTSSQRRRFYNASSHEWIVTDAVLEELDDDLQSIVACTAQDDFIFFSTERRIKPRRSIIIPRRLTLSSQPRGSLIRNGVITEAQRKVRLTCPDEGDLLTVSGSITIANMIFTGCNGTGSVVVVDSRCTDGSTREVVRLVHTEFRNNVVSDNHRLLETVELSCTETVMDNVVIRENQCESGCMSLSQNNTLRSIRFRRNQAWDGNNTMDVPSVFMMSVDSETVATNISASRNQIRLFTIVESRLTLIKSTFNRNAIPQRDRCFPESVGGSILLSNSSIVDISDSAFVNNSGWNGGAIYASASEFNISNCTFLSNGADAGNGGALYAINGTSFTLFTCTFSNNNADLGAGIYSNQSSSIQAMNSTFLRNNGTSGAGLYIVDGDLSIESSEFHWNRVSLGGGALVTYAVNASILDSTFMRSRALWGGACIFTNHSIVRVIGVKFAHNRAIRRGEASAIYANHTTLDFRNVSFNRNSAYARGSTVILDSTASFDRVLFQRNQVVWNGAGIYSGGSNITVTRSSFFNNAVGLDGGAIYSSNDALLIRDTNFTNNIGEQASGCLFRYTNATLRNLIFHGNRANTEHGGGGGLYMTESRVIGQELLFEYNHAVGYGGGCYISRESIASLTQSQFINNTAQFGGGVHVADSTLNLTRACIFRRNYGGLDGGAIHTSLRSNSTMTSCVFDSNAAESGGSFFIAERSRSRMVNCTFINSTATSAGGGIQMNDNTNISITNSTFTRCLSGSEGGAINIQGQSNLKISSSRFLRNRARNGAGVYTFNSRVEVDESVFKFGGSVDSGGGIYSTNGSISIWNSSFEKNVAEFESGGGIFGTEGSFIDVVDTEIIGNSANRGAGLYIQEVNTSNLESVSFVENEATRSGGGARVVDAIGVQSFSNCRFVRNTAEEGGCLAGLRAEIRITNMSCGESIARNRGGGLVFDQCNATMNDTEVISNQAHNFSGILATDESQLVARNLSSSMNIASNDGGGIGVVNGSSFLCNQCNFRRNMATRGAGLYIEANDSLPLVAQLQDSSVLINSALTLGGGMLFVRPRNISIDCNASGITCSHVALLNTDFQNNTAGQSGAAVLTSDPEGVFTSCSQETQQNVFLDPDQISSLEVIDPRRLCRSWRRNQVARNAPGDTIGTFGQVLSFSTDPDEDTQIIGDVESGFVLENVVSGVQLPVISVTALDAYGNGPLATRPDPLEATMISPDGYFQGAVTENIVNGFGNFSNIVGFKPPGNYSLRIFPNSDSLPLAELVVRVRGCEIGEEPTEGGVLCQRCDAVSFNFDPGRAGGCAPCPSDATCESRFIVPEDGYWHKSPCHANVKECLTDEACSYKDRQTQLRNYTEDIHVCEFNETALMEYGNVSCREGYEGPLCGSCAEGYGLSLGFKCFKCAIRGGLPITSRPSAVSVSSTSAPRHKEVREERRQHEAEVNIEMVEMLRDEHVPPEYFQEHANQENESAGCQQSPEQQLIEVELTRWITTEIFKVMINFLQVTAVAAAINVRWTEGTLVMFEASEYIGALSTAALSRPIDCLVSSSSAVVRSIWRTLLSLFVPGTVMAMFTSFWGIITCHKSRGLSYFWKRITLSIIAVTYISYIGLTRLAVRVFYCVDVYDSDDIFSDSQNKVWAIDTSIKCYQKEHISLIIIAVLILVLVSFSFPLITAVILSQSKVEDRDTSTWIMETMGFLYRAFKKQFVLWESLVMLRKACLSIIVVFSYPLGGQAQGLLALLVLLFSHHLHFICSPYKTEFHCLNYYESGSLLISSLTFVLSQFFADERSSDSARVVIAVVVIVMNTLFFSFLFIVLFRSAIVHLKALLKSDGHATDENACWWVVLKVYIKSVTKQWTPAKS